MALVSLPVILRQMLAANEDDAGGNSPITVFNPVKKGATINTFTTFLRRPLTTSNYSNTTYVFWELSHKLNIFNIKQQKQQKETSPCAYSPILEMSRNCSWSDNIFEHKESTIVSTWCSLTLPTRGPRLKKKTWETFRFENKNQDRYEFARKRSCNSYSSLSSCSWKLLLYIENNQFHILYTVFFFHIFKEKFTLQPQQCTGWHTTCRWSLNDFWQVGSTKLTFVHLVLLKTTFPKNFVVGQPPTTSFPPAWVTFHGQLPVQTTTKQTNSSL